MQVIRLQAFLKVFEKLDYVQITGVFDEATLQGVMAFQQKYSSQVLTPWGISQPTGYVYKLTLAKINQILCGSPMPVIEKVLPVAVKAKAPACPPCPCQCPSVDKEGGSYDKGAMGPDTVSSIPIIGQDVAKGQNSDKGSPGGGPQTLGAALITLPSNPLEIMQCLYELLLILVVLYILGNVLESVLYKDVPENAAKRFRAKWITIVLGLAIAFLGSYLLKEYCLLLPLTIAFLASLGWMLRGPRPVIPTTTVIKREVTVRS